MSGEKKYLLDTNAIIAISVITEIELLSFSRLSINEEAGIKAFL